MALTFPSNPVVGQTYTEGQFTYAYDGVKWTSSKRQITNVFDNVAAMTGSTALGRGDYVKVISPLSDYLIQTAVADYQLGNGLWAREITAATATPLIQPRQTGDGTTTTFDAPGTSAELPQAFFVVVDGLVTRAGTDYTTAPGQIIFTTAPAAAAEIDVTYFKPVTTDVAEGTDVSLGYATATGSTTARTLADRAADVVNVKDFGAVGDGVTDDTAAIQAAFTASDGTSILFPTGRYLVTDTIPLDGLNFADIRFDSDARILAGANNITIFQSSSNAWGVKVFDPDVRGNGFTGVIAFDVVRLEQLGAGIYRPVLRNLDTGIFLRSLCTGCKIESPDIHTVDNPIVVTDAAGGVQINHPRIDTFGSIGIHISPPSVFGNVGVQILGGYIQNGSEGIRDRGIDTNISGTYFETCTVSDIKLDGARYTYITATNHTSTGNVAIFSRNTDGAKVMSPFMSSGGRTVGLFDFDTSNTNCFADFEIGNSTENTPVGSTVGLGMFAKETSGTFTPIVAGSGSAGVGTYTLQTGTYRVVGKQLFARFKVAWTGHTGTGNLVLDGIPDSIGTVVTGERLPILANAFTYTGTTIAAGFTGSGKEMAVYTYASSGTVGLVGLPAAGTIEVNGTFTLV